jgi:hypothetical protein
MDNMARYAREPGRTAGSLGRVGMENMAALALQGVAIVVQQARTLIADTCCGGW